MDTEVENAMHIHRSDGTMMTFKEYKSGLYYFDTTSVVEPKNTNEKANAYLFLHTVASNKAQYTSQEIKEVEKARRIYRKIDNPSEQEFGDLLKNSGIRNCPLTRDDAHRALHIWEPAVQSLKSKMTKKQNRGIPNYQPILIPAPIIAKYNTIRLFIDIFGLTEGRIFTPSPNNQVPNRRSDKESHKHAFNGSKSHPEFI